MHDVGEAMWVAVGQSDGENVCVCVCVNYTVSGAWSPHIKHCEQQQIFSHFQNSCVYLFMYVGMRAAVIMCLHVRV